MTYDAINATLERLEQNQSNLILKENKLKTPVQASEGSNAVAGYVCFNQFC